MLNFDDLKERQRLAETYAAMTDGELLKLASNPEALTEVAWEALEDELDVVRTAYDKEVKWRQAADRVFGQQTNASPDVSSTQGQQKE